MHEICELTRVALREHETPVTKIISKSIKLLKKHNPGLKLIVSYADPRYGHLGIIYQAGNWIYTGKVESDLVQIGDGFYHRRTIYEKFGTNSIKYIKKVYPNLKVRYVKAPKYKYLYPLSRTMQKKLEKLRKPYPKKIKW